MRLLHLHSGNLYGGVETFLATLAFCQPLVPELEHEFGLCFEGRLSKELDTHRATVRRLGEVRIRRPWSVLRARGRLAGLLETGRYDAVICHAPWAHVVFAPVVKALGKKLALFLHGPVEGRHWLERWAGRTRPDLVIANSRFTASTADRLFFGLPPRVLYLPVMAYEPLGQGARAQLRASLSTGPEDVVIIQASRMEAWKGHSLHLQALGALREQSGWRCWMVGGAQRDEERTYESQLRGLARELGIEDRVQFLGQRDDVRELLSAADIYCQPNTSPEPFGLSLVEAMDAGLPVVSTAMGGAQELIDASCGFLVPPDVHLLARVLKRLVSEKELRYRLGEAGHNRAHALCEPRARLHELAAMLR